MVTKFKTRLKRLAYFPAGLIIGLLILFFVFIAPNRTVPILMYHSITNLENKNDILALSRDCFERQMQYLSKHNYYVASLSEVGRRLAKGEKIPRNWVVLTFDDGYRDFYTQAYPVLKEKRFIATVFVTVNYLDNSQNSLNWQQLEKISKEGLVGVGGHALSHRMLPLLSHQEVKDELIISKQILEKRLEESVNTFCYPYGALDDSVKQLVKKAGFELAVGTAYQRGEFKNNDVYILKRVFVSKVSNYPLVFRFMLSGYYVPTRELVLKILNIKTPRDYYNVKNFAIKNNANHKK
jgi:peptidoglycan/xylan/chitin deacetylase (PgdA/CDA1 family)